MSNFFDDPMYHGRAMLIPLDRLPDSKTADLSANRDYKIIGVGKVIELDGKKYIDVKRWKIEK